MAEKRTVLTHLKEAARKARDFASNLVAKFVETTIEVIEEIDEKKADKPAATPFHLPVSGWSLDDEPVKYPYFYDVAAESVTANDRASISIAPDSVETAVSCELCPTSETMAGGIRIRAKNVPAEAIYGEYWIEQGKEM